MLNWYYTKRQDRIKQGKLIRLRYDTVTATDVTSPGMR